MYHWYTFSFMHPRKAAAMMEVVFSTLELKKFSMTYDSTSGVTTFTFATKMSIEAIKNTCQVLTFYDGIDFDHAYTASDYEEGK